MKFKTTKETLLKGLQTVGGATSATNSIVALSHVLLKASDNLLQLATTDLEILLKTEIEVETLEQGGCLLPAQKLQYLIQTLPSAKTKIEITLKDRKVQLLVEETNSNFQLPVLSEKEFPDMKGEELETNPQRIEIKLNSTELLKVLKNTQFAASNDAARSYLGGVLLDLEEDKFITVATDSHRLAMHQLGQWAITNGEIGNGQSILLPLNAVRELIKILPAETTVKLSTDGNMAMIGFDGTRMATRLIGDEFPNYRQVIPNQEEYENRIKLNRQRLLNCVNRATLLTDERTKKLLFEFTPDLLTVRVEESEEGTGEEKIVVENSGNELTIAFNGDYLAEILKYIEDEEIYLDLISSDSPGTFRATEEANYLYLVMPMRLS